MIAVSVSWGKIPHDFDLRNKEAKDAGSKRQLGHLHPPSFVHSARDQASHSTIHKLQVPVQARAPLREQLNFPTYAPKFSGRLVLYLAAQYVDQQFFLVPIASLKERNQTHTDGDCTRPRNSAGTACSAAGTSGAHRDLSSSANARSIRSTAARR